MIFYTYLQLEYRRLEVLYMILHFVLVVKRSNGPFRHTLLQDIGIIKRKIEKLRSDIQSTKVDKFMANLGENGLNRAYIRPR